MQGVRTQKSFRKNYYTYILYSEVLAPNKESVQNDWHSSQQLEQVKCSQDL